MRRPEHQTAGAEVISKRESEDTIRTTNQSLSTEARHQRKSSMVKRIVPYKSEATLQQEYEIEEKKKRAFEIISQRIASSKVTLETENEGDRSVFHVSAFEGG